MANDDRKKHLEAIEGNQTPTSIRNRDIWIWGVLGGISPTLAHFAGSASQVSSNSLTFEITPNIAGLFIGLGSYAFLGGIIARGFGARDIRTAMMAGIAAPGIVTSVMSGQTIQRLTNEVNELANPATGVKGEAAADTANHFFSIVSTAYAQASNGLVDQQEGVTWSSDWVSISPQINGGVPLTIPQVSYNWSIIDPASGTERLVPGGVVNALNAKVIFVPDGAQTLIVNGVDIGLNALNHPGETVRVEIETKPTVLGDFIWALGGGRDFSVSDIKVTLDPGSGTESQN